MIYKCSVCGYVFDEEKEGRSISDLTECPVCRQPADRFVPVDGTAALPMRFPEKRAPALRRRPPVRMQLPVRLSLH